MNKENLLKNESVKKALLVMVIPSVIAGAINQLNVIIDTFFLGNFAMYSTQAQTATATSMPIIFMMSALSIMVAIGSAVTCSRFLGKNDKTTVQRYMANSFVYGWLLYFVILIVVLPLLPSFISLLTSASPGDVVYENSMIYTKVMVISFPTIIFTQLSAQTIRAEGHSTLIVKVAAIQVVINILVNYIFITDTFSMISFYGTKYEAIGAALGTVVSQLFMSIVLMRILFNKEKTNYYINIRNTKFTKDWLIVLKNGMPQFIANTFFSVGLFLIGISITMTSNRLGYSLEQSVNLQAASGISIRVIMMMFLLLNGGIQGIQGFVSYQYGSNASSRLSESLVLVRKSAFVIGLSMFFIFFIFSTLIAQLFSNNQEVIELVSMSNKAFAITMLIFPSAHSMFGLFAAVDKARYAVLSTVFRDCILLSLFSIILPLLLDDVGVMLVLPVSLLIGSIVIAIVGRRVFKKYEQA